VRTQPFQRLADYPFARLRALLTDVTPAPGQEWVNLALGEPQDAPPNWLPEIMAANQALWNRYPSISGTADFRSAVAAWLTRRYDLSANSLTPDEMILPAAGTREALFQAASLAVCLKSHGAKSKPVILLPDPFYAAYEGAAIFAGADPVFLPASAETGYLPALGQLSQDVLARTVLCYLCSPSNPTGAVADANYLQRALRLARGNDFILAVDECYSELYDAYPPVGAASVVARESDVAVWENLLVFNSLSKRSNAAGLRSGFICGGPGLIAAFTKLRSYGSAGTPLPILAAATALWQDDNHVVVNRDRYRERLEIAEEELGSLPGFRRPEGGFFLWLKVGDGEAVARRLWERFGIKVLPGRYLSASRLAGVGVGDDYLRIALVHTLEVVRHACRCIRQCLNEAYRS